jgi:mono/diheme cytochrome c family protein
MRRWLLPIVFVVVGAVIIIQAVPYGRHHINPPVLAEPNWDSPQTRALVARACFDCHSNETVWPWYSNVAPVSWLVQHDVDEARRAVNFSEWNRPQKEARDSAKTVRDGEMPPWLYAIRHRSARLSAAEKEALAAGLAATLGSRQKTAARSSSDD